MLGSEVFKSPYSSVLDKYIVFKAQDIDQAYEQMSKYSAKFKLDLLGNSKDLDVNFSGIHLAGLGIMRARYGTSIYLEPNGDSFYFAHTILRGSSQVGYKNDSYDCCQGDSVILSPSTDYSARLDDDCDRLMLRIAPSEIRSYLSSVLCQELTADIEFDSGVDTNGVLSNAINFVLRQIAIEPRILERNELKIAYSRMIIANLVMLHSHNYSNKIHLQPKAMLSPQLKRAVDFIWAKSDQAISAADVALHCNVALRTLQRGFIKYLDTTPTHYIRNVKLELVHEKLQQSAQRGNSSVKQILLDLGVVDFGRFANYYRSKYGCTPSETMKNKAGTAIFLG